MLGLSELELANCAGGWDERAAIDVVVAAAVGGSIGGDSMLAQKLCGRACGGRWLATASATLSLPFRLALVATSFRDAAD